MAGRLLIPVLLLTASLPAGEPRGKFAGFVARLSDEDAAMREKAAKALIAQGSPALPDLRAGLAEAKTDAHRATIREVIAAIEKREPHGIRFAASMLKIRIDLNYVNGKDFRYLIQLRNGSDKPVVLWPYFSLRVLDREGREVKPSTRRGRWGLRSKRYLQEIEFLEIPPGESRMIKETLATYMHDPEFIEGWQIPQAGDYTLEFTYHFDRAAAKKGCDPAWTALDDPKQPWNRALELEHVFTAKMRVFKPRPRGVNPHDPHGGGSPHGKKD